MLARRRRSPATGRRCPPSTGRGALPVPPRHTGCTGRAEGARSLLSTLAGSVITVTGVAFSITIVSLQLASTQFGPRMLRNFMRDISNQLVLAVLVATFVYCLLVRTVRGADGPSADQFVPSISITVGLLLAVCSIGALVYFIHHMSAAIQADNVVAAVAADLNRAIDALFPARLGGETPTPPSEARAPAPGEAEGVVVAASASGYLQAIDADRLLPLLAERDRAGRIEHRPGRFVIEGDGLMVVWPAARLDEEVIPALRKAFVLGRQRTLTQDAEFGFDQLAEIAVRALLPGINDPATATACLDRLGAALCRVARRLLPSPCRFDREGRLRIVTTSVTFPDVVHAAFDRIRQNARGSVPVLIRLVEVVAIVARQAPPDELRRALLRQVTMVGRAGRELPEPSDREAVGRRVRAAEQALALESLAATR